MQRSATREVWWDEAGSGALFDAYRVYASRMEPPDTMYNFYCRATGGAAAAENSIWRALCPCPLRGRCPYGAACAFQKEPRLDWSFNTPAERNCEMSASFHALKRLFCAERPAKPRRRGDAARAESTPPEPEEAPRAEPAQPAQRQRAFRYLDSAARALPCVYENPIFCYARLYTISFSTYLCHHYAERQHRAHNCPAAHSAANILAFFGEPRVLAYYAHWAERWRALGCPAFVPPRLPLRLQEFDWWRRCQAPSCGRPGGVTIKMVATSGENIKMPLLVMGCLHCRSRFEHPVYY